MATDTLLTETSQLLSAELRPCVDHLVTEDDTPVDSIFSEKQQRLLTEPLYSSWVHPSHGRKFVALANVGFFYTVRRPPYVPDMLLSLGVELPADVHPKPFRSYFLWEYGKPPDVVIEIVSNLEGGEDTEKLAGYARIGVPYYVIFDHNRLLSDRPLRAFQTESLAYRELAEPIWLPGVDLGLQLWPGRYEDHENTWLRWVDEHGQLIPSGAERADQERERVEHERERADREGKRAERLAEQLCRLGAEPEV